MKAVAAKKGLKANKLANGIVDDGLGALDWTSVVHKKGENSIAHVMDHSGPSLLKPNKKVHTIFKKHPIRTTNKAWKKQSMIPPSDGVYIIPMKGAGTLGENAVKIVVVPGTNKLVTAFPIFL